jgi:predicted nucleic acid-binding protein
LLEEGAVLTHPFVICELFLGVLAHRQEVITELQNLPTATAASNSEILTFIASNGLQGSGVGLVDAHLLGATRLTAGAMLWTRDKRLLAVAERLGVAARL